MKFFKSLFLTSRFFLAMGAVIITMMMSYAFPFLLPIAQTGLVMVFVLVLIDITLLYNRSVILTAERDVPAVLSLGDNNPIRLRLDNRSSITLSVDIVDEIPEQFQLRNFRILTSLAAEATDLQTYELRPVTRGEYMFGAIHLFAASNLRLIRRKVTVAASANIPVYPSIIQMKRYELKTFDKMAAEFGVKKVRRIGHSYEFEHIKQYQRGDDYRSINWRATGRRAQLMVNQYEDEKSQQIYCIVDKSRVMHMPFHGLSLFDYAVNASLVMSNIALAKQDKAGLITFADTTKSFIKADRSRMQLKKILETLYKEKEGIVEANYESLYMTVKHFVSSRSLLFLYTNFESTYALQRALPQLRKLNDQHLLVVVFFENTEITKETSTDVDTLDDVYTQITAEQYALNKVQIAQQLKQLGIFCMLTKPENLTVATINKYLELKSRGLI